MIALIQIWPEPETRASRQTLACKTPQSITPTTSFIPNLRSACPPQRSSGLERKVEELPLFRRTYHHCGTFQSTPGGRERARAGEHETLPDESSLLLGEDTV